MFNIESALATIQKGSSKLLLIVSNLLIHKVLDFKEECAIRDKRDNSPSCDKMEWAGLHLSLGSM